MFEHKYHRTIDFVHSVDTLQQLITNTWWLDVLAVPRTVDANNIVFDIGANEFLAPHSFQPRIHLCFTETEMGTCIHVDITLKKPVQIFVIAYSVLCLLFQAGLIVSWILEGWPFSPVYFIPAFVLLLAQGMCYFGIRLSSRDFIAKLKQVVSSEVY